MARIKPLADPSPSDIESLLASMLGATRQAPSTLLALWLHLPITIETPNGPRMHRSTFEASLTQCRHSTNRDEEGKVRAGERAGDWLGAIGYLTLLDQIGGSVQRDHPPRISSGQSGVERALADFSGICDKEAVCLYALRNSLAHNFSLVNYPVDRSRRTRRRMTRLFTVTEGGTTLIHWPTHKWSPHRPNGGGETVIDLKILGDVVEEAVREMRSAYRKGMVHLRRDVKPAVWRRAHFFSHVP